MFVYRSIVLGLLGAACLLLATRPGVVTPAPGPLVVLASGTVTRCPPPVEPLAGPTIIDASANITPSQLGQLVMLAQGERIAAVNDVPVASAIDAGILFAGLPLSGRRFIDLTIAGAGGGPRRVLVLLHD